MGEVVFLENSYAFLDNANSGIVYKGIEYPTLWHAFESYSMTEAKKFELVEKPLKELEVIAHPHRASMIRRPLMLELLKIKFGLQTVTGNDINKQMILMKKLLATGDVKLRYGNYHCDTVWGECHCHDHTNTGHASFGQNLLGDYLIQVRRDWRSYIEEINDVPAMCECGKPAQSYVLYTGEQAPTMPRLLAACGNCYAQIMDFAISMAVDGIVIPYNPHEELSTHKDNIIPLGVSISIPCPSCHEYISKSAFWCPKCGTKTAAGFALGAGMTGEHWALHDRQTTSSSSTTIITTTSNERQYKTKVIQC